MINKALIYEAIGGLLVIALICYAAGLDPVLSVAIGAGITLLGVWRFKHDG